LKNKLSLAIAILLFTVSGVSLAQNLQNLKNQPPDGAIVGFLMTDGTVMYQGNAESDWWRLTPDKTGSYVNGTWKQMASLPSGYVPLYFAGSVLADGRLIIEGGEYLNNSFAFTNLGAVYDPAKNVWTNQKPPKGWGFIGDSPSTVLPDGRFLLGSKFDKRDAVLDPKTLTWTELNDAGKNDRNAEEGWTLMPDGSVQTYDVSKAPHSEKYDSSTQKWISTGSTIVDLHSPTTINGCIPYGKNFCYYPPEKSARACFNRTVHFSPPVQPRITTPAPDTPLSIIPQPGNGRSVRIFPKTTTLAIPMLCCCLMVTPWWWVSPARRMNSTAKI
jgi:hypothetical protein